MSETAFKSADRVVVTAQRCWDGLAESPIHHTEVLVVAGGIVEVGARVERGDGEVIYLGDVM
ncbi:MAG: hypothetical protein JWO67_694 [Streptosporangiaceae bacterium]|nr:hypothetical protein [Streptosporangiaceae bacterium]